MKIIQFLSKQFWVSEITNFMDEIKVLAKKFRVEPQQQIRQGQGVPMKTTPKDFSFVFPGGDRTGAAEDFFEWGFP